MQVLIIKISAIGDTIMTLPTVAALRRRYPTASVAWLCSETTATVVRLVSEIEVISVNERKLFQGSLLEKISEVIRVWRRLRRRHYDLVVVGHTNRLGPAENIELSEERLDVALDGDFGDSEIRPDKFVGLAGREQLQNIQLTSSQFLSGQSSRKLCRDGGREKGPPGMHFANALKKFFAPHVL